jgi:hypothetical protein
MARRCNPKIKQFRGAKQLRKDETARFMAGELKPKSSKKRPPLTMSEVQNASLTLDLAGSGEDDDDDDEEQSAGYNMQNNESEADDEQESQHDAHRTDTAIGPDHDEEEDETGLEDGETQMITPPTRKQKRQKHNQDDAPITIDQYKAMVTTLQAQLRNAEQQIRAISKSSLVDKFMAGQVKKYVKESLWKRCKFITCRQTMEECMEEVAHHFGIIGEKREHWKSTYEHAVRDALNNRRNNTAQGLKKELTGTCVWTGDTTIILIISF